MSSLGMDELVWNHISSRVPGEGEGVFMVTPGDQVWDKIMPKDLILSSHNVTANVLHAGVYEVSPIS